MRKLLHVVLLVGILGLWPFWVAVVWVVVGATTYAGSQYNYWNAAPWIIIASIPACIATTIMAFVANHIFQRAEGGTLRKVVLAGLAYIGGLVLIALCLKSCQ